MNNKEKNMVECTLYIPYMRDDEDYSPSFTGNETYPTVAIRGVFDSYEKALDALKGWRYEDCYDGIEECTISIEEGKEIETFDINYDNCELDIYLSEYGGYVLNESYDEEYSAVYDEEHLLGVYDW